MEADWDELSHIPVPPPGPHALPTIATAIAFDDVMELLWVGNEFVGCLHLHGRIGIKANQWDCTQC